MMHDAPRSLVSNIIMQMMHALALRAQARSGVQPRFRKCFLLSCYKAHRSLRFSDVSHYYPGLAGCSLLS